MSTLNLKVGDVVIVNLVEWVVLAIYTDPFFGGDVYWARSNEATPRFTSATPSMYGTLTKKEPIFQVGHTYENTLDPLPRPSYTVAIVDGVNVLVWWLEPDGSHKASWVPYDQRKFFIETNTIP